MTLPKLSEPGFDPNVPGVVPVPDKGIVRVGFDALEVTVMLPAAAPLAVGVNATLKVALCPALSVTGAVIPLIVNPVPAMPT